MFRRACHSSRLRAGWIIETRALPLTIFPHIFRMVNAVYGTGALFKALKVRTAW